MHQKMRETTVSEDIVSSVITPKHFTHATFFAANSCFCQVCIGSITSFAVLMNMKLCWGSPTRVRKRSSFSRLSHLFRFDAGAATYEKKNSIRMLFVNTCINNIAHGVVSVYILCMRMCTKLTLHSILFLTCIT